MSTHRPLILLGTHRSGTTWLGHMLSQHPDLAYWEEPRYVWSWGNAYKGNDLLVAADATDKIKTHIRNRFSQFVKEHHKKRLLEKTPSNCLRVSFINEVYPEAKILHIIRDGRSVFSSANHIVSSGFYRQSVLTRRLLEMFRETAPLEWPANASRISEILVAKLTNQPIKFWGPRPPGWETWQQLDSLNVLLTKQWVATVEQAIEDSNLLLPSNYYRFYYEDLIENPRKEVQKIFEFAELSSSNSLVDNIADSIDPSCATKWSSILSSDTLSEIRPYLEPTLNQLGYGW